MDMSGVWYLVCVDASTVTSKNELPLTWFGLVDVTSPPDSTRTQVHCCHYYHHQRPLSHCLSLSTSERQKFGLHLQPKRATITAQQHRLAKGDDVVDVIHSQS